MPTSHVPGRDPLPASRVDAIHVALNATPAGEQQDARDLLGELDRIRPLLHAVLGHNEQLLDMLSRVHHVYLHPILGTFCRTCRADVEGQEGCEQHSPVRLMRHLVEMHATLEDDYRQRKQTARTDADRAWADTARGAEAYAAVNLIAAGIRPILAVLDESSKTQLEHTPECRAFDCRCGCDREQDCRDCHRCVCWRSECCAEQALQGALQRHRVSALTARFERFAPAVLAATREAAATAEESYWRRAAAGRVRALTAGPYAYAVFTAVESKRGADRYSDQDVALYPGELNETVTERVGLPDKELTRALDALSELLHPREGEELAVDLTNRAD